MDQLRGAARARTRLPGSALTAFAVTGEPCVIQDLSASGASVVFREGFAVPRCFDLFTGEKRQPHQAVTIWRNGNVAGVKFLKARVNVPEVLSD